MADHQESIPSMVDGLNICQRKILFCSFEMTKFPDSREQFSDYVSQHSAYNHGKVILASTIIRMAQNFVGSNNLNLLEAGGELYYSYWGAEDHAEFEHVEHIYSRLSPFTRYLFPKDDDIILDYLNEDGRSIEPTWYVPIIPTVPKKATM